MNSTVLASHLISFPYKGGMHLFSPDQIIRIEGDSNYSIIHTIGHRPIIMAKVLRAYEAMLTPFGFLRTHKSHLINPEHVEHITQKGIIRMKDESEVSVSRRKRIEVLRQTKSI